MDEPAVEGVRNAGRTRFGLAVAVLVFVVLALQVVVAVAVFGAERPAPYGWQMYSAVPYSPRAWAVTNGERARIDVEGLMVHPRAEIDRVELLRDVGCERIEADGILIELADGTMDEVTCR